MRKWLIISLICSHFGLAFCDQPTYTPLGQAATQSAKQAQASSVSWVIGIGSLCIFSLVTALIVANTGKTTKAG